MAFGTQHGYDIEAMATVNGELVLATQIAPPQYDAIVNLVPGVAHSYTISERNSVRLYRDGAALESGTGYNPPSCMAWVFDSLYMSLVQLGWHALDPHGKWRHNTQEWHDGMPELPEWQIVWSDMVKIPKDMVMSGPKEITVSGCNPRFNVLCPDAPTQTIRNYKRFLIENGAPLGFHLHFGMHKTNGVPLDKIKCMVTLGLSAYLSQDMPGALARVRNMGIGMFRDKEYGFEWTDLGLCAARNLILSTGILGMARSVLTDWSNDDVAELLRVLPYEATVNALPDGHEAARQIALQAHDWTCNRFSGRGDDTVPWFGDTRYGQADIRTAWRRWIAGGFPDNGTGYWYPQYNEHEHGLETSTTRALQDEHKGDKQ